MAQWSCEMSVARQKKSHTESPPSHQKILYEILIAVKSWKPRIEYIANTIQHSPTESVLAPIIAPHNLYTVYRNHAIQNGIQQQLVCVCVGKDDLTEML